MIINEDINPNRQLYFIGGLVLECAETSLKKNIDFFETYKMLKEKYGMSMNLFSLAIDWLFLIGAIKKNGEEIILCS